MQPTVDELHDRREWKVNEELHRVDGPAIEYFDGGCAWYQEGELHRLDGPAVEFSELHFWFIQGWRVFSYEEFQRHAGISDQELVLIKLRYGNFDRR